MDCGAREGTPQSSAPACSGRRDCGGAVDCDIRCGMRLPAQAGSNADLSQSGMYLSNSMYRNLNISAYLEGSDPFGGGQTPRKSATMCAA
ncbi:MAG: hypothetical protein V1770_05200 [bacterium]